MVLPTETVIRFRRRVLEICQEHSRKVVDAVREVPSILTSFRNNDKDSVRGMSESLIKLTKEAGELKRNLMMELTQAGAILLSREDFLRLIATSNEIVDYAEGIAFRLVEMTNRGWKVRRSLLDALIMLAEASLNTVVKLREAVYSLSYSAERTKEAAKSVEEAEGEADSIYREVDLSIIDSDMDLPVVLLLRDVARFLEEISDKAEDAADAARILSLTAL
jgi:predicted phosphate transport protein (TIGR00153 family)